MTPRFQIRQTTYRGREGFSITGGGQGFYRTKIFTESRASAEHIRAQLRANPQYLTVLEDFRPRG